MFEKKTIRDVAIEGKTILVRTDYNVPLTIEGEERRIESDFRIRASLPTIEYLLAHRADKIILISHLGRPERPSADFSLRLIYQHLETLLPGQTINFVDQSTGLEVEQAVENMPTGSILLLENLRFDPREKANDPNFAREIVDATGADLFVLDGFGVSHRTQGSTVGIAAILPAVAGLLLEKEVTSLLATTQNPDRPFVTIVGGAKVADKQPIIEHLLPIADRILVGGKIAADGYQSSDPKIIVAKDFDLDGGGAKLDIGPVSTAEFVEQVQTAKTVLWNGTLGKTEDPAYATASTILAKVLGENSAITSIICGGDTTGFVEQLCATASNLHFSLISTGGGATLELLSGKTLPGVEALDDLEK